MLRILALLCALALLLAPLGTAQAEPACEMLAAAQDAVHSAHGSDHKMPMSGHAGQGCKQLCAIVVLLAPTEPIMVQSMVAGPSSLPLARLLESQRPDPSERPPKNLV